MNETNQKGLITESYCQVGFSQIGIMLSKPISHDCRYDYIADINGKLIRIQCKTSRIKPDSMNSITFNTRSTRGSTVQIFEHSYTQEEIDYFYTWFNGISYLIPVKECGATAFSLYLKDDAPKNLKNRVNFSKDYELTTTLKRDFQYNAAIV